MVLAACQQQAPRGLALLRWGAIWGGEDWGMGTASHSGQLLAWLSPAVALYRARSLTSPSQDRREHSCAWRAWEWPLWERSLGNEELAQVAQWGLAGMRLFCLAGFRNNLPQRGAGCATCSHKDGTGV